MSLRIKITKQKKIMNFNHYLSFLGAIICAYVGLDILIYKPIYLPMFGITPTWQSGSILMFVFYCVNISLLAKDLQERPDEWTGGTLVQRQLRVSIYEMFKENRNKQLLNQSKNER